MFIQLKREACRHFYRGSEDANSSTVRIWSNSKTIHIIISNPPRQWRTQEKISRGGVQGRGSGLVGGPWGSPPDAGKFSKIYKKFKKKIAKTAVFSPILQRNYKSMRYIFARLDETHNWLGKFWENFENFWWKFNRKIEFLSIFW